MLLPASTLGVTCYHVAIPLLHMAWSITMPWSPAGRFAEWGEIQCVIRNSTPLRNGINLFNLPWPGSSTHQSNPRPSHAASFPAESRALSPSAHCSIAQRYSGSFHVLSRTENQASNLKTSVIFFSCYTQMPGQYLALATSCPMY